jgi:N-acyl homoserine lactone hydrolase
MRLYAIHAGGERADMAGFYPFDPTVGTTIDIPYFVYLICHPSGNVLFDTGGHPDLVHDPRGRLGPAADMYQITMQQGDDVVSRLATIGVAPSDVEHVVMSHLHYDHSGGIEFFPHATVYTQREELRFAFWPAAYHRALYVRADFDGPVRWRELTGEYDLFGDARIVCIPTPGHSPGHQSLLVRLDGGTILLVADATYLLQKMRDRALPAICWSPDAMLASWEQIEEIERREQAELICTHDLDFRGRVRLAPDEWYE